MPAAEPLRVSMTVEQAWHSVPAGSGTYVRELLRAYRVAGSPLVSGVCARHHSRPADPEFLDLPLERSPLPRAALYRGWQRLRRPRAGQLADVVHATTWAVPGRRVPLVVTVHDLAFRHDPGHFTPRGVAFFERGLQITLDEATAVIVPSSTTSRDCVDAGIDPGRVHVVPHGVRATPTTATAVVAFRARHRLTRPYVLWTGTREPRKNLPRLVSAFAGAVRAGADLDLVLVGPDGWGSERERLRGVAEERVRILGRLSADELAAAYAGAHVFCYPSLFEGFGMPVAEAMAHAVPVITSRDTAMEEVAEGAALLVDPRDVEDVTRGLLESQDPTRREELVAAATRRAGQLSWAAAAHSTESVLAAAAGRLPPDQSHVSDQRVR